MRILLKLPVLFFKLPVLFFKLPVLFFKFSLLFFKFPVIFFKFSLLFFKLPVLFFPEGSGEGKIRREISAFRRAWRKFAGMNEKVTVVKVGGKVVETPELLDSLIQNFVALPGNKVLVHGGGRTATQLASRLGIETKMVDGRRITDAQMIGIVTMVYAGLVNKNLIARLQARGLNAVGLTGADMNLMLAHKRPVVGGVDFGFVGDVDRVDGRRLASLLQSGLTPVMIPLTHDGAGHLLNTNADTVAAETAKALAAAGFEVTLTYCFEHAGVLAATEAGAEVIPLINAQSFRTLVAEGVISGGMIPKIENALAAVEAGVRRVVITKWDAVDGTGGTSIE